MDWSSSDLNRFKDLIDLVTSSRPELTGFVWAATALAISFPLAALFLLIGLLGYYGKLMGIVLGGIPVGILSYLVYVLSQLSDLNGVPLDLESVINALSEALQQTSAYGIPIYAGAGMSLFLLSLLDPGRKP